MGYYTAHIGNGIWSAGGMDPLSQGFVDSLSWRYYLPEDHPEVVNAKFDTSIDGWSGAQVIFG